LDATLAPVAFGKIVATLHGSDVFDGGVRVVTQKVEATTGAQGEWSLELIVNGEGEAGTTTWTVEGYNQYVVKVFEAKALFLASALAVTLGDLERMSAQNLRAAREAGAARLVVASDHESYLALPEAERRPGDLVLVDGLERPVAIQGPVEKRIFDGVTQIFHGTQPAMLLDANGAVLVGQTVHAVAPAITRQPAILPETAGLGDSITLDLGSAEGTPPPAVDWDLTLGDNSIRDRVDPQELSMELSEPGAYALEVNWSNEAGTVAAAPALLTVAEPAAPGVDYAQAAGYFHSASAYVGEPAAVTALTNDGNGGWDLSQVSSGEVITMTPAGVRFNGGRFLQAAGLSSGGIDGVFIVLRMALEHYGSGVAQLFAANPNGGHLALNDNNGTLQARYNDGTSRNISLGSTPYGPDFVAGLEIDTVLKTVRTYMLSGSIVTESPLGMPRVDYATVRIGQAVHGTLKRAALFARPAGGSFAASFEQVIADFLAG
ncbi:hypothetical protein, partial [Paracoccus thiocyanatus]|uniref:hypothetical protein n=1 Tax=Paracoccus thiocyanatus TaxID=34006 RepID=UPI00165F4B05